MKWSQFLLGKCLFGAQALSGLSEYTLKSIQAWLLDLGVGEGVGSPGFVQLSDLNYSVLNTPWLLLAFLQGTVFQLTSSKGKGVHPEFQAANQTGPFQQRPLLVAKATQQENSILSKELSNPFIPNQGTQSSAPI